MEEVPGEPSKSEGAGDTAIRIIRLLQEVVKDLEYANDHPEEFCSDYKRLVNAICGISANTYRGYSNIAVTEETSCAFQTLALIRERKEYE